MAKQKKADRLKYNEPKFRYQIMLTMTASEMIDQAADELGLTRSEVLEQMIRNGDLELIKKKGANRS